MSQEDAQEVLRFARCLFKESVDWVQFFKEVLGKKGKVRRTFAALEDYAAFESTPEYAEIQAMLMKLRTKSSNREFGCEPVKVITVRLPESMHAALRDEAHLHQTTLNKLCISKLLQIVDQKFVPTDT